MSFIHHTIPRAAVALFGLLGVATSSASAQCLANEIAKLTASDASSADHFGTSVAILNELAIVGTNWADGMQGFTGAVYVFRYNAANLRWEEQQKLIALDGQTLDGLGISVALNPLDPNVIIVGAWRDDDACPDDVHCESGSAYVFRYDPDSQLWAQEQKLTASDGTFGDRFGRSVSIWGDVAVIGAWLDDDPGQGTGSAYVFRYDPASGIWTEQQKLIPSDPGGFGTSASLQGDLVLIGAPADQDNGLSAGAAWIFRFDPNTQLWVQEHKLLPADPTEGAAFGWSVSLDGGTALVAAYSAHGSVFGSGAVYVFTYDPDKSGWTEQQKLTASDGATSDKFGWSISLDGDKAVIGADTDDDVGNASGSAYLFGYDGKQWNELAKLHSSDIEPGDTFGSAVGIDGEFFIVTANLSDDACEPGENCQSGSAYIFGGLSDCNENGELDLCDIADGFSPDDNNNGIPDECEPPPCPWDLDDDAVVGVKDLLSLLGSWGPCPPKGDCPADFDNTGDVGVKDLLFLLGAWGPCA